MSRPPLATSPPTHPTQIFTRTRTSFFSGSPEAGNDNGLDGSIAAVVLLDVECEPNKPLKSTRIPYLLRLEAHQGLAQLQK